GVHERGRHVEPLTGELDEKDLRRTPGPSEPHVQATDRTGADDDDDVPFAHLSEVLGGDRARERRGDRGLGGAHASGGAGEAVDLQDVARHDHVLREPALELVAHRDLVGTDRHGTAQTELAVAARDGSDDLDTVAGSPALDAVTDLDDLAGDLVPHDPRW